MNPNYKNDPYRLVGTTLGGFRVVEFIQSGGMGAVYRARPEWVNITLAIKVLKPDLAITNPETVKLLFKEAEQTAALNHPNIIRMTYAEKTDAGYAFIVMEWLEGHSLDRELEENGPMEPERVAALLEQVCAAISHAHGRGVVHRDLKPSNIMLTKDHHGAEQVKVLDFGIAKAVESTFGVNSRIMGAPQYASPEQLTLNTTIDHRSDIYSLGVTAYFLLSGELPFDTWSITQQLAGTPKPLREVRPDIPEAVEAVVRRAMAKRPGERFQDADEFARAFRDAASIGGASLNLMCLDADTGAPLTGASVHLNGLFSGSTDEWGAWSKAGLVPKEYLVEVGCHQYERASRNVRCTAAEKVEVEVGLTLKPHGELLVRAPAAHATVILNGAAVGTIDESGSCYLGGVAPGPAHLQLKHPKFHAAAVDVEVARGEEREVEVEMRPRSIFSPMRWLRRSPRPPAAQSVPKSSAPRTPRPRLKKALKYCGATLLLAAFVTSAWLAVSYFTTGRILIRANTPGARVTVGGVVRGSIDSLGNFLTEDLTRGTYTVEISADGFVGEKIEVEMKGRETPISFTLRRDAGQRVRRGNQLFAEGKFAEAAAEYREAVTIEPDNPEHHRLLGDALLKLNRAGEAEAEYEKAANLNPDNPEYRRLLAEALLAQDGKADAAEAAFLKRCELSAEGPDCYFNTGVRWLTRNEAGRAVRALDLAIEQRVEGGAETAPYYARRAEAHLRLPGHTEQALSDATRAVELDGQNAGHQGVLGDVYDAKQNYAGAIRAYRTAANLAPTDDDIRYKLGKALYTRAQEVDVPLNDMPPYLNEAIQHYRKALSLTEDPDKKKKYQAGLSEAETSLSYVNDNISE